MTHRGTVAALALVALASVSREGHAESSITCPVVRLIEVCAGTPEYPDADYVMVDVESDASGNVPAGVTILDHCGALAGYFGDHWYTHPSSGKRLLIGRVEVLDAFGVQLDGLSHFELPVGNGWLEFGSSQVIYGDYPGANAPALPLGKALKLVGGKWILGDPAPKNSLGAMGVYDAGSNDGGAPDAATMDAAGSDAGYVDGAAGAAGGGTGGYPPCPSGSGSGGSCSGSSGSSPIDASLGGSSSFPPPNRNDDDGCSCRTSPREPWPRGAAWLLTALGVALLRRRAR